MWTQQVVCFYFLRIQCLEQEVGACRLLLHLARVHVALGQGAETEPHRELEGGEVMWMR